MIISNEELIKAYIDEEMRLISREEKAITMCLNRYFETEDNVNKCVEMHYVERAAKHIIHLSKRLKCFQKLNEEEKIQYLKDQGCEI